MTETMFHAPDERFELEARRYRVREGVALGHRERSDDSTPRRPHGGLAALAVLFGTRPRHRAA
jgi:hypothetical protein